MGESTELVFVEGHSHDDTYAAIETAVAAHPERACQLLRQTGNGKGDAVRLSFARATGEILMILDADLTVAPEELPRFYEALCSGKGSSSMVFVWFTPWKNKRCVF
jgi:glycosyltransferase involved in cell wall biosynthesis